MHKRFILHIVSRILLLVSLTMTTALAWAAHDDPHSRETTAFLVTILLGVTAAVSVRWICPLRDRDLERLNVKDALALVGISWVILSLFGALPLVLSGASLGFTDAFFEVVSGFTTTGATIFPSVEVLPRGILFWRSLTHWLGGMGIIVLSLAVLPALGPSAYHLYRAESPGIAPERISPSIGSSAKILWAVYVLLSVAETLVLTAAGMTPFEALCQTFGTMATGGFSTRDAGLAAFNPFVQWVVVVFMFLAGTNFILHVQALRGRLAAYRRSEEFRAYLGLVLFGIAAVYLGLVLVGREDSPLRAAAFQTVSILTTTGFSTADFDGWPWPLRTLLLGLMVVGGCGGSTGGGLKVIRVILLRKVAGRAVLQAVFPNLVRPIRFDGRSVREPLVTAVCAYFIIFMGLLGVGTMGMILLTACDFVTGFSAALASLSNIGPGLGRVGPAANYAWVSLSGKWLLTFLMLAGRLELYSILILFVPAVWRK